VFEAIFRIVVLVETDEQGQRVFPVTKHRTPVNEAGFLSLLALVYHEEVYPKLRTGDALTITVHLDLPLREVERTFHFREGRLFEEEGSQQPVISDPLPLVQGVYEKFVQQVGPGEIFTLTFHVEQP
jgi:hypothetical protein